MPRIVDLKRQSRVDAITALAVAASDSHPNRRYMSDLFDELATPKDALKLAYDAYFHVVDNVPCDLPRRVYYAEAEALLRTGWVPSSRSLA